MSANRDYLLNMLPDFFAELREMAEIAKVEGEQFDNLDIDLDDLLNQCFIFTATWGLAYWERRYLLPDMSHSSNWDMRRNRVLAAKRSVRSHLLDTLKTAEPSIDLTWNRLILTFSIEYTHTTKTYHFGRLIQILANERPSHLSYSFELAPHGYTVLGVKNDRNQMSLQALCGTFRMGTWSIKSTLGDSRKSDLEILSKRDISVNLYKIAGAAVASSNISKIGDKEG